MDDTALIRSTRRPSDPDVLLAETTKASKSIPHHGDSKQFAKADAARKSKELSAPVPAAVMQIVMREAALVGGSCI